MIKYVKFVGSLDIKFDNVKIIKKGTYEKIDELKLLRTEFGFCKGYQPHFRPIEGQSVENADIKPESIYLFAHTSDDMSKLKKFVSEKGCRNRFRFGIGIPAVYMRNPPRIPEEPFRKKILTQLLITTLQSDK